MLPLSEVLTLFDGLKAGLSRLEPKSHAAEDNRRANPGLCRALGRRSSAIVDSIEGSSPRVVPVALALGASSMKVTRLPVMAPSLGRWHGWLRNHYQQEQQHAVRTGTNNHKGLMNLWHVTLPSMA